MQTGNKFELLARAGYGARGVVYFLVGGLALVSTFGGHSQDPSSKGALAMLLDQPFGKILLGLVGLGLLGHAAWRFAQGIGNADHVERDAKGWATRAGHLTSGVTHLALAGFALQSAWRGSGQGSGSQGEESLAAWLMQQPFGPYLVGLCGIIVMVAGGVQAWRGISKAFKKRVHIPADKERLLTPVCRYGLIARGVVFAIIGGFLIYAALTVSPENAGSIPEALAWVRGLPFGAFLYFVAALGLFAFGGYSVVEALYRRIDAPSAGAMAREARDAMPKVLPFSRKAK